MIRAKIESLFGRCKVELGEVVEAQQLFMRAMIDYGLDDSSSSNFPSELSRIILGLPFPTSSFAITVIINRLQLQQQMVLFCRPINVGIKQGYEAEFCDDVSDCLALMCNLFIVRSILLRFCRI